MQTHGNNREARAQELLLAGAVEQMTKHVFLVHGGQDYRVIINDTVQCQCKDHETRGTECKHIIACELYIENGQGVA